MRPFWKADPRVWPDIVDALTATGLPWEESIIVEDLRWMQDQVEMGRISRILSRRQLAERWSWGDKRVRNRLRALGSQQGPNRVPTGSQQGPKKVPTGSQPEKVEPVESGAKVPTGSQEGPKKVPTGSQQGPNRVHTRVSDRTQNTEHRAQSTEKTMPDDEQARSPVELSARSRKALKAAGLPTAKAVQALTLTELRKRDGIGPKTANEIVLWLADRGLQLRPEAPKASRSTGVAEAVKDYREAWDQAWKHTHGGESYPWDFHRDNQRLQRVQSMTSRPEKAAGGFMAYIRAAQAGKAFPNEPPTIQGFLVKGASWLIRGDRHAAGRPEVSGGESLREQLQRRREQRQARKPQTIHIQPKEIAHGDA